MPPTSQQQHQQQQQHHQQNSYSNQHRSTGDLKAHSEDDDEDEEDEDDDDIYMEHREQQNFHQDSAYNQKQQLNASNPQAQDELSQAAQDDEADRASDSSFSDSVSLSSTPSIPCSDDIDFTLVYALHTFLATVDGQASVVKGDQLTLLDDSNSYWWLIRVLNTEAVGYIPAENIETPFERLARLNKHRNVDLSSATPIDVQAGAASSLAQTRFSQRIPSAGDPVRSRSPQDRRKGPGPPPMIGPGYFSPPPVAPAPGTGKGKTVAFTAPTYFENSGNEWSDDEDDESGNEHMMDGEEVAEGDWDGEGEFEEGEEGFEDEEEEESEEDDEDEEDQPETTNAPQRPERAPVLDVDSAPKPNPTVDSQRQLEEQLSRQTSVDSEESAKLPSGWARLRLAARASADSLRGGPSNSNKDDSRSQLGKGLSPAQRAQLELSSTTRDSPPEPQAAVRNITHNLLSNGPKNSSTLSLDRIASTSALQLPNALTETKRLTLTPDIARDSAGYGQDSVQSRTSRDSDTARPRSASVSTMDAPFRQSKHPTRPNGDPSSASTEVHSQSIHSTDSHNGVSEEGKGSKQTSSKKDEPDPKKKKTGGLLSGFFGRKKDKKTKSETLDETRSSSLDHDRHRSSSPISPSEHSAHSLSSPQQMEGSPGGLAPGLRAAVEIDDVFSTDAALKKQQGGFHHQHGISSDMNGSVSQQKQPSYPPLNSNVPSTSLSLHSPFSPASSTASVGVSFSSAGVKPRPGSLIGSPGFIGLDVPMLNVLRIFAGDNVDCEATFKTVLLSAQTTTQELITQALQRFHVLATEEDKAGYYLTIKDVASGEETTLSDQQTPLKLFELMNDSLGQHALPLPSVKRSSVGSISSISSNLSLNPAISRLGMNDFSDDSAVKFYINRYPDPADKARVSSSVISSTRKHERSGSLAPIQEDGLTSDPYREINGSSDSSLTSTINTLTGPSPSTNHDSQNPTSAVSTSGSSASINSDQQTLSVDAPSPSATSSTTSPSLRFAMRVRIYSVDLPEGLVFDPQSNAIIPKTVLVERGQRAAPPHPSSSSALATSFREKVIIFPRNTHVSEAIEHALEAFGIAEGVVDGGDDVDDKISKRRNSSKIRYGLSMKSPNSSSSEVPVNLISKVLDAYSVPPIFRPADRTSKEARRRSQEYHPFVLGTLQDLQPTDPIFSLRRALHHHPPRRDSSRQSTAQNGLAGAVADELGLLHPKKNSPTGPTSRDLSSSRPAPSTLNSFQTAVESIYSNENELIDGTPPVLSPSAIAVLSTHRNSEEGIDINLKNNARIRSRRDDAVGPQGQSYRYSYIDTTGEEYDISELIESELNTNQNDVSKNAYRQRSESYDSNSEPANRVASPSTEDGYASAPESPMLSGNRLSPSAMKLLQQQQTDDETAIEALRAADLTIDDDVNQSSPLYNPDRSPRSGDLLRKDLLAWTVRKHQPTLDSSSSQFSETPQRGVAASLKPTPFSSETLDERLQRVLAKVKPSSLAANSNRSIEPSSRTKAIPPTSLLPPSSVVSGSSNSILTVPGAAEHLNGEAGGRESCETGGSPDMSKTHSQKGGQENNLRGSVHSSRSNSTNDDGSVSPTTPLTATSPTGETSSNYTPISSATRGIGIDSRQSMNRETGGGQFGGPLGGGPGHGQGTGARGWLPLLFPPTSGPGEGPEGGEGLPGHAGLDVLMNLIHHSAASSSAAEPTELGGRVTIGAPAKMAKAHELWADEAWLGAMFNEPSAGGTRLRSTNELGSSDSSFTTPSSLDSSSHLDNHHIPTQNFIHPILPADIVNHHNLALATFNKLDHQLDRILADALNLPSSSSF